MKLQFITSAFLLVAGTLQLVGAKTCKTLMDNDSTLVKSLARSYHDDFSDFPFSSVFSEFHAAVPWLSKCAASIDPVTIYASMRTSQNFLSCLRKAERTTLDDGLDTAEGWKTLCPLLENTAVPCVKNAMVEIVMDAFATTDGCCDAMLAQVQTLFSNSLTTMVEKLVQYAVNIACSERKFTNHRGKATTELCGYSILKSLDFIESEDDIVPLVSLLQLPNAEMCDAFAGKAFKAANGSEFKIGFGTKGADTMGICLEPVDALLEYVVSWPIFAQTLNANGTAFSPLSLFTSVKSLSFATLRSWFETPTNLPAIVADTLERFAAAVRAFQLARYQTYFYYDGNYTIYYNETRDGSWYGSWNSTGNSSDYNFTGSGNWSDDVGYGYNYSFSYASYQESYNGSGSRFYGDYWSSSSEDDSNVFVILIERFIADIDRMLLHIPNGGGCTFSSQTITMPFDVTKASAIDTVATAVTSAPTVAATTVSTQSSGAQSLSVPFSTASMAIFLVFSRLRW